MKKPHATLVIRPDGNVHIEIHPDKPKLKWLQDQVCGYIEAVRVDMGGEFWVNEDGLIMQLTPNKYGGRFIGRPIVGNLVCVFPMLTKEDVQ